MRGEPSGESAKWVGVVERGDVEVEEEVEEGGRMRLGGTEIRGFREGAGRRAMGTGMREIVRRGRWPRGLTEVTESGGESWIF